MKKRNKISTLRNSVGTAIVLESIIGSFGEATLAETGSDYNTVTLNTSTNNLCVPENAIYDVNDTVVTSDYPAIGTLTGSPSVPGGEEFYITEVDFSDATCSAVNLPITPTLSTFNGYPGEPTSPVPGTSSFNFGFSFEAPAVSYINGFDICTVELTATARQYFGSSIWGEFSPGDMIVSNTDVQESFDIRVEHVNTPPTISAAPPTVTTEVTGTVDVDVSATVNDEEGNEVDIIFELSDDDFATILQTQTYSGIDLTPGDDFVQSHTFTALSVGAYNWRVRAVETGSDVEGACIGEAFEDPPISYESDQPVATITLSSATIITGYVFVDTNSNGVFDSGELPAPNVTVFVTDGDGQQSVVSDSTGFFSAGVLPGSVTVEVDENDPDIPENYLSQGPVTITAVEGESNETELPLTTLASSGVDLFTSALFFGVAIIGLILTSFKSYPKSSH